MKTIDNPNDLYNILSTFDTIFKPSLSEDSIDLILFSEKIAHNAITYTSEIEDELAGFISFYANEVDNENTFIVLLAVNPKFQGRRIAYHLLMKCIETSIAQNKKGIKLEVEKNNHRAISFYKQNDFRAIEEAKTSSVYMLKTL